MSSNSRTIITKNVDRKSLDDALGYVVKSWMPISPQIIAKVRGKLQNGEYEQKRYELIADLKKDFSLFTWFLSRLHELRPQISQESSFDIEGILRDIEIGQLADVFSKADDGHSPSRDSAIKPQTLALKQSLAAVSAAESIAEHKQLDSNLANMCAGVRQLGINLVAWNYPRIFSRAVEHCQANRGDLDQELAKILGYAPIELGSELAFKWDQTGGLRAFVTKDQESLDSLSAGLKAQLEGSTKEVLGCVELAETVSKLAVPEFYPDIAVEMPGILKEVDKVLGPGGFDKLKSALKESARNYSGDNADLISLDIEPNKIADMARGQLAAQLIKGNPWVIKCPALYQEKFKSLYLQIDKQKVSPTAINILVGQVIPALGFTRGCVYLVEDSKNKLNPILRIGETPINRYKQLDCSASEKSIHPVIAALGYNTPLIQERVPVNGEFVSHVTGTFSGKTKTGVLYLEMSDELCRSADRSEPLLFFKAIRQALLDCLNLS